MLEIKIGKSDKPKKKKKEFTKVIFVIILINAVIWINASYVLAFLDKYQIAENLSIVAVTTILGAFITYGIKSFLEKNSRNKYKVTDENSEQGGNERGC